MNDDTEIVVGMPAGEYHGYEAVSASMLKRLTRTPAHLLDYLERPPAQSDAMAIGEALHTAVLEPDLWLRRWVASPKFDRRTTVGKTDSAAFEQRCQTEGLRCLDPADYAAVAAMAAKLSRHPAAAELLRDRTHTEVSVFWTDRETGLRCKARPDFLTPLVLGDVKTTKNASQAAFAADVYDLGYQIQFAHYLRGLAANGIILETVAVLASENTSPFEAAVYEIDDRWLIPGDEERARRMRTIAECRETGEWPGYPTDIIKLEPPVWVARKLEIQGSVGQKASTFQR